jgi:hypothetical protein
MISETKNGYYFALKRNGVEIDTTEEAPVKVSIY